MILIRNVFRLKFGKAKDVKAAMKDAKDMMDPNGSNRVMFDLVGPSYTMVMESTYKNLAEFESTMSKDMGKDWQDWYQHKFVPLVDSAYREIFTVLE